MRVKGTRPRGPRAALSEEPMERRRSRQGEEQPEQEQGMKRCGLTPVAFKGRGEDSEGTLGTTPLYRAVNAMEPHPRAQKGGNEP